ncbi:aminotransferase class III-fold pyridoxal phosphate-dependent enzyme, partial [Rhodobacteraceae bacterium]|nr:aminotransferase class III-fold pyridoxal phosphate-dependent enzyme [Paracoccaceae bacterium]
MNLKATCVVQARLGSTRLPNKILLPIHNGLTAIDLVINRIQKSKRVDKVIVATTTNSLDDKLCSHIRRNFKTVKIVRGSEEDVLARYCLAIDEVNDDTTLVRITADCPLVDPNLLDEMVDLFSTKNIDYLSNTISATFPDGFDIEIFKKSSLLKANYKSSNAYDREHVTPYLKRELSFLNYTNKLGDYSGFRATLDEQADLEFFRSISKIFDLSSIGLEEFCKFISENSYRYKNQRLLRDEGSVSTNNQKRFKHAQNVLLGGTSLFSKNPNLHHPKLWPSHFKSASGINIIDVDNTSWRDISFMGIGTNVLGYADPDVDKSVKNAIDSSNMSSLNSYEEILLAEKLLEILDLNGLVKFTRSGGEANLLALRIARAATGKNGIAFCGYHGWHDWYLSVNLGDTDALNKHLLQGLSSTGVPSYLKGKVNAFSYNSIEEFDQAISDENIGTVIMEPMRNTYPDQGFIEHIRQCCSARNIVLIFDECSSGFRETYGGYSNKFSIKPDLQVFGKTIANGYALNAIVGKREIMEAAETSFISSTFWSEKIGYAAALATLDKMKNIKSFDKVSYRGALIKSKWESIFDELGLNWKIQGTNGIPNFVISSEASQAVKTYITQAMLRKHWLASTVLYVSVVHTEKILNEYFNDLYEILFKVSTHLKNGD